MAEDQQDDVLNEDRMAGWGSSGDNGDLDDGASVKKPKKVSDDEDDDGEFSIDDPDTDDDADDEEII